MMKYNVRHVVFTVVLMFAPECFSAGTFYWTGADGNWSDPANWSMDEAGTVKAERCPGTQDGVTDDIAHFTPSARFRSRYRWGCR